MAMMLSVLYARASLFCAIGRKAASILALRPIAIHNECARERNDLRFADNTGVLLIVITLPSSFAAFTHKTKTAAICIIAAV